MVSRGYGGKAERYPLLVNQDSATEEAGDEPVLIYQRTGVRRSRFPRSAALAVEALLAEHPLDIIVTDDGLQHYRPGA